MMGERTYGGMTWEEIKGHALPLDMPHDDLWELMRLLCQGAFCSYCGEEFLYDDHIKSFLVMQEHIKTCPKHPLSAALARIEALEAEVAKLKAVAEAAVKTWHVLNTYADDYWPLLPVMAWLETPLRAAGMLKEGE